MEQGDETMARMTSSRQGSVQQHRSNGNRKRSEVWDHFNVVPNSDPETAACKHCHRKFRCSSKSHGTSNMKCHLYNTCSLYPLSLRNDRTQIVLQFPSSEGVDLYALVVSDALKDIHPSVSSVRNAVRFVRSSPHRAAKFKECIKFVGIECQKFVCLDVSTRWSSTYLMLDAAEKYQAAFDKLGDADASYRDFFDDDSPPSNFDWENVRACVKFLKHFNGLVGSSVRSGEPSSSQSQSQPSGCA